MTLKVLVYASIASLAALAAPARAQTPAYQGKLSAKIVGPRKVASMTDGAMFVVDASGRLHRLTRRGELVAPVLEGVTAVTVAQGTVVAAVSDGSIVQVNPRTGRVLRRLSLGTSEPAAALAYDEARGKLWIASASGMLRARTLDGAVLHDISPAAGGTYRLTGVAVDPAGTVWVAQDRTGAGATLHAYDGSTGAFVRSVPVAVKIVGGLTVGADGKLYVSDLYSGTVQVIATDGQVSGAIGSHGSAEGQLRQPASMAFMANGDLVVANMDGGRLDRFGSGAALPECAGDADCDGLSDEWENANRLDPNDATNALADTDADGLNDTEELVHGSNPRSSDTDGDGYADAEEVASGFNPADADDHRPQLIASGGGSTDPGLVRLSATVQDPVSGRGACSAVWKQVSGAPVTLNGGTTASPSFVGRAGGTYAFEAVASCGGVTSRPQRIEVAVNNVPPRADAGRVVVLAPGMRTQLSGWASADANGDALTYEWRQVDGAAAVDPVASKVLTARLATPGTYGFRLAVKDASGAVSAADVPVVVLGLAPVPVAASPSPLLAVAGEAVTLDASRSYRGAAASFEWRQVDGAEVTLDGAAAELATFVPPAAGGYAFEVVVVDGGLRSPPARVQVFAAPSGGALPVARASAPAVLPVGAPAVLDGSASTASTDAALVYAWRQVSGPAAGLTHADRATATVVPFEPGSYEFELAVSDEAAPGVPARVRFEARRGTAIPVAVATARESSEVGELVLLDGRASTRATRYRWTQVEGPWALVVQGPVGSFVPARPGTYTFELEVDDGIVRSAPARVSVVVLQNGTEN